MRRYAMWALFAALAWWVIEDPASAARVAHALAGLLSHAAASLSALASGIAS